MAQVVYSTRLAQLCAATGVETVFIPRQLWNTQLSDAFENAEGNIATADGITEIDLRPVRTGTPDGAVMAAAGYRHAGGPPAAVVLDASQDFLTTLDKIGQAVRDKLSMVIILVEPDERFNGISANWASLVTGVGAIAVPAGEAENVSQAMVDVIEGLNKQLPAVLIVKPENLEAEITDEAEPEFAAPRTGAVPQTSQVVRAAKSLAQARWPLIIAGRGARHAKSTIVDLANTTGALLATSAGAHGLFEDQEFNIGVLGRISTPATAELARNADVIVAFGCALDDWTTRDGKLIGPNTLLIQVDTSPWAVGRFAAVSQSLIADAQAVAIALDLEVNKLLAEPKVGYRTQETVEHLQSKYWNSRPIPEHQLREDTVDARAFLNRLEEVLPTQRTVIVDQSPQAGYATSYLRVLDHRGYMFFPSGAVVAGMGASIARDDRLIVVVTDESGLMDALTDFRTAVENLQRGVFVVFQQEAPVVEMARYYGLPVHEITGLEQLTADMFISGVVVLAVQQQ
ncbi:thiamine pyrophosphate-binding protein [Enteractinococcus coprophilus]|uniref:Thiamine pyrophosphate-dependent acetolactate synthase large subunit-like protein n=1 Tax=Enteractinococcus coprophilus TaxID=1027633 RepID=A0A543AG23_9MICC|nr:thiamine pyrophosphate-binding protein [Enteractinococcus coprophilus]TQL71529.1 thiamine pyrophosphate-dependent acetolactate synthase large subunit-like protein [Enteractinococcus coprophilus]